MIFCDTSYFVALALGNDKWHEKAVDISKNLKEKDLCVSDYIISEAVTILGYKIGGEAGRKLYEYLIDNYSVFYVDEKSLGAGMEIFSEHDGKLSVTDAVTVHLMGANKIKKIVSFDTDFDGINGIERIR